MAEEVEKGAEEASETIETPLADPADPDEAILARYSGDPKKLAAAYRNLQGTYTKTQEEARRYSRVAEQLTGAGYQIDDEGTVYAPAPAEKRPAQEAEEQEDYVDPRAAKEIQALRAQVTGMEGVVGAMTAGIAEAAKRSSFGHVTEDVRPALVREFDNGWRSLPLGMRTAENAEVMADRLAMRAIRAGKFAGASKGRSEGENAILDELAGAADGTRGSGRGSGAPATADMRQMYDALDLKGVMSFEEYARQATEAMR